MPSRKPRRYLSLSQLEDRIGVTRGGASKYELPTPDVVVGPLAEDGTVPRGTVRGWLEATVDKWNANRPGHGGRPPLKKGNKK